MPGHPVFAGGRQDLRDAEEVADRLPSRVGEQEAYLVGVPPWRARVRGADVPGAVHLEVSVHGQAVPGADQQVLAPGDGLGHRLAAEVDRGVPGNPVVAAGQHPPRQGLVQAAGGVPDDVTFGHYPRIARVPGRRLARGLVAAGPVVAVPAAVAAAWPVAVRVAAAGAVAVRVPAVAVAAARARRPAIPLIRVRGGPGRVRLAGIRVRRGGPRVVRM